MFTRMPRSHTSIAIASANTDNAAFWRQAAQQGYTPTIPQIAKTGLFPSQIEALGPLGVNLATSPWWTPTFPYRSLVTKESAKQLAQAYESKSGRQWNQVLGSSMSLLDGGVAALERSADPKDKEKVTTALSKLKITTMTGPIDFTNGPVESVSDCPILGGQWVKGTKYPLDCIVTDNTDDRHVPVAAKLQPYTA